LRADRRRIESGCVNIEDGTVTESKTAATGNGAANVGKTYSEEHPEDALSSELTAEQVDNLVLYEKVDKHIAVLTLNRPERLNAFLAPDSFLELRRKIDRAQADDEIKVIVLTGKGETFSAGVDLRRTPIEHAGLKRGVRVPQSRRMRLDSFEAPNLLKCDKTVIAAVNGPCLAAGFHFVISSDIIVAGAGARFGEPESRIGFAGFSPGWPLLALKLGFNRARAMLLTGRVATAEQMHEWGVVDSVVAPDKLMDEALRYARAVAWHSTDNLMLGRRSMQIFYELLGVAAYDTWTSIAHPLFTNVVWREDEFNFMRQRNKLGMRGALSEMQRQWTEMGF
jgi:enoyl-CoA hydratase